MARRLGADAALADTLGRIERGAALDLAWLQRHHPHCWEEVHQSLAILARLEADGPFDPLACIGAQVDSWRLDEWLGAGSFGSVFLASGPDGAACVKVLDPDWATRRDGLRRFLREARLGSMIRSPHVVSVLGSDTAVIGGYRTVWLAMEYEPGMTLAEHLAEHGPMDDASCREFGRRLAEGLAAIHATDAVHRDLKPHNIWLPDSGGVRLLDLGVAHADDELRRSERTFAGTLRYAAPEQFESEQTDARSDLYALGVVLHEAVVGAPYRRSASVGGAIVEATGLAKSNTLAPAAASPFLRAVLDTLLEHLPENRFESAAKVTVILSEGETGAWWRTRDDGRSLRIPDVLHDALRLRLHGRGDEMATLRAMRERARERCAAVLIDGEDGIGKTRLVAELARESIDAGWDVQVLRAATEPFLAGVAQTVLVFEDLDEQEREFRAAFLRLSTELAENSVLLVGTLRPAPLDPWVVYATTIADVASMSLHPLLPEDAVALYADNAASELPADPDVVAGGLPLAILAAARRTRSQVELDSGVVQRSGVPRAVLDALHADLESLRPSDAHLLGVASCVGEHFAVADVACGAASDLTRVSEDLLRLARSVSLILESDRGFRFVHPLVHRGVHALASASTRVEAHRRLADAIEAGGLHGPVVQEFVRHVLECGDGARAAPHIPESMALGLQASAVSSSSRLCRLALESPVLQRTEAGVHLWRTLAVHEALAGDIETARSHAKCAIDLARQLSRTDLVAYVRFSEVGMMMRRQRSSAARPIVVELLADARERGDASDRLLALRWMGKIALQQGSVSDARAHFESFDRLPESSEGRYPFLVPDQRSELAWMEGDHEQEGRVLDDWAALADERNDDRARVQLANARMRHHFACGRLDEAWRGFRALEVQSRRQLLPEFVARAQRVLGTIRGWCGDREGAARLFGSASAVFRRTGMIPALLDVEVARASMLSRLGDARIAYRHARRALRFARHRDSGWLNDAARTTAACVASRAGYAHSAHRMIRAAEAGLNRSGREGLRLEATAWRSLWEGELDRVAEMVDREERVPWFARLELAHALFEASPTPRARERLRRRAQQLLDACPAELTDHTRHQAPEVVAALSS